VVDAAELERRLAQRSYALQWDLAKVPVHQWQNRLDEMMRDEWLDIRLASVTDLVVLPDASASAMGYSTVYIY
jgi:hypothetical protein